VTVAAVLRLWGLGASRFSYDEAFTAMAGRLSLGHLFTYLMRQDSHPPLDYLLHLPLARAGVSELWFRLPSALLSIGAVALFAWWMRSRGRAGIIATALLALCTFQIVHGRQARMYAELELLGVGIAVLAAAWLARPRRAHAVLLGVLVFAGLMTHTSMFLLAAGLLALPGLRTDRPAWLWRGALLGAGAGWAALWGSHFVVQAQGGHSAWIPSTTPATLTTALGGLLTPAAGLASTAVVLTALGAVVLVWRERVLGRVWICCFAVPVAIGAVLGLVEPVVLDRTFTLMAWAPILAVAYLVDWMLRRVPVLGAVTLAACVVVMLSGSVGALRTPTGPDVPLRQLAASARPGDLVAVRPATKAPEVEWSLGVRTDSSTARVHVPSLPTAFAIRIGHTRPTGRVWILDWHASQIREVSGAMECARHWTWGHVQIHCLDLGSGSRVPPVAASGPAAPPAPSPAEAEASAGT
jgi:hypothetical protein